MTVAVRLSTPGRGVEVSIGKTVGVNVSVGVVVDVREGVTAMVAAAVGEEGDDLGICAHDASMHTRKNPVTSRMSLLAIQSGIDDLLECGIRQGTFD